MLNDFIGRQPILDEHTSTYGYELLFRQGSENYFSSVNGEDATLNVIANSALTAGMNTLSGNKKVFINFTEKLLLDGYWSVLPKENVIIEILESVNPSPEIIDVCKKIKQKGYMIALDDFTYSDSWDPIIDLADIIKVDIKRSSRAEVEAYAKKYGSSRIKLLAERVETLKQYYWTRKLGYTYFQGYYFSEPEIIRSEQIPSSRLTKLRLIHEVNKIDFDYSEAEALIKHDPGLTLRLLKYINSAATGIRNEVTGIRQALTLIGQRNIRKWVSILAVSAFTDKKPPELMHLVVKRGQFCELLASPFGFEPYRESLFLVGIFSLLDGVLDMPMQRVLEEIPLSDEIKTTLQGKETKLQEVLSLAKAFESGDWDGLTVIVDKYGLNTQTIIDCHINAIEWANNFVD